MLRNSEREGALITDAFCVCERMGAFNPAFVLAKLTHKPIKSPLKHESADNFVVFHFLFHAEAEKHLAETPMVEI